MKNIKIQPKDRIYVKGYGFLSFAKNFEKFRKNILKNYKITKLKQMQEKPPLKKEERQQIIDELRFV